jgi:mycothiol synthase
VLLLRHSFPGVSGENRVTARRAVLTVGRMSVEPKTPTWRPLATDDARAWAELLNAIEAADKTGENYDEEDALQELTDPYADLERASLGAFDGERMVGYSNVMWRPDVVEVHRVMLDGGVHPEYRRQGIGTRLLRAGVAAAKDLHALHHPTLRLVVDTQKGEHIAGIKELMTAEGFTPARYFQHMEHPLGDAVPDAALPEGLRLEPWSEANDPEFLLIRNESFQDHWGSSPHTPETWRSRIRNHNFQGDLSFLLRDEADGTPAGMLVTMYWEADTQATGRREAHFMLIGTVRAYRRRGVASALIAHALREAAALKYDRAGLGVDSANPSGAFALYEKAGFRPKERYVRWALEV